MFDLAEIHLVRAWLATATADLRARSRARGERGASEIASTVILIAVFAAAAIAIGALIVAKFTGKANEIPTG